MAEPNQDIRGLEMMCQGLEMTSDRMKRASIIFVWDKYVLNYKSADSIETDQTKEARDG